MNDVVALITGANKTLQNTNKVGNGLKSIGINLAGVKANAKDGRSNKLPISSNWYTNNSSNCL